MSEEKAKVEGLRSSHLQWLDKYSTSANDIIALFHEDFAAIKKTLIDKNKKELEDGVDAQWYAKRVAKYIIQSVTRSMENLTELRLEIIKEVRDRQLANDDWLSEESHIVQNNASDGKLKGFHSDSSHSSNTKIVEDDEVETISQPNNNGSSQNEICIQGELLEGSNNIILNEVEIEENPRIPNGVNGDVNLKVNDGQECKSVGSDAQEVHTSHYDQSDQPVLEPIENCDINSAPKPKVLRKSKQVIDDQVPGPSRLSHLSTRRMARAKKREFEKVHVIDSSDTDYEEPVPAVKKTRSSTITAVNKTKIVPQPQPKPISIQTVSTRRGPLSRTRNNIKAVDAKSGTSLSKGNKDDSNACASATNEDYWKTHNFKEDVKLNNNKACRVVLKGLEKKD